ncbi:hypothetical protein Bca52824_018626 [Brassica carinata]|uniref:Pentatricopeptide repeat-containing protein n=1 Tax=Brassica carinata TaxID=52824 RepID=A0A8X8AWK1_BRACI|nr:hypothetical protein Bca52824_018626 [Brassica carinata]
MRRIPRTASVSGGSVGVREETRNHWTLRFTALKEGKSRCSDLQGGRGFCRWRRLGFSSRMSLRVWRFVAVGITPRVDLTKHAKRVLAHSSNVARLFCTNTNATLSTSNQTLQSRIDSALHQNSQISTVLEQWRQQGNKLNPSLVRGIFEKLRDSKQYPQALEVSTWMTERNVCSPVPEDYTTRFHLIENVLGFKEAEKFLEKVPENLRNESMYAAVY